MTKNDILKKAEEYMKLKYRFELTEDEMTEIRKLDSGKRFFNMTLEQQEQMLGSWKPED